MGLAAVGGGRAAGARRLLLVPQLLPVTLPGGRSAPCGPP
jgi:hypothetical protein